MTISTWSKRVSPMLNSRHFACIILAMGLFFDGFAIFMFDDASNVTTFKSNLLIWYAFAHMALLFLLAAIMAAKIWAWRIEQLGIVCVAAGSSILNLLLPSYLVAATYSAAAVEIKLILWLVLIGSQFWFALKILRFYAKTWADPILKKLILLEKEDHYLFFQQGEIHAREIGSFKAHINVTVMIVFLVVGLSTYFFNKQLSTYFGMNWVPIAYAFMALPFATLGTMLITLGYHYLTYLRGISKATGKTIYLDNMTGLTAIRKLT